MAYFIDHYAVLGVSRNSEDVVIKAARNALMLKYHPDTFTGDLKTSERKSKEINEAFYILSDPHRRADYDARLKTKKADQSDTYKDTSEKSAEDKSENLYKNKHNGGSNKSSNQKFDDQSPTEKKPKNNFAFGMFLCAIIIVMWVISKYQAPQGAPSVPIAQSTIFSGETQPMTANRTPISIGSLVTWDSSQEDPKTYTVSGVDITLSSIVKNGYIAVHLKLNSTEAGVLEYDAGAPTPNAQPSADPNDPIESALAQQAGVAPTPIAAASFVVKKLDVTDSKPSLILMTYTGGAHCCTIYEAFIQDNGVWRRVLIANEVDGVPPKTAPMDVDHDGIIDFVLNDDRFNYAFSSYAKSYTPAQIFNVIDGQTVDVSKKRRFEKLHRLRMRQEKRACELKNNSACAAFVASATRLGLRSWAWKVMLENYDQYSTFELPSSCDTPPINGACPDYAVRHFKTFPEALDWFLNENNYKDSSANQSDSGGSAIPMLQAPSANPFLDAAGIK